MMAVPPSTDSACPKPIAYPLGVGFADSFHTPGPVRVNTYAAPTRGGPPGGADDDRVAADGDVRPEPS